MLLPVSYWTILLICQGFPAWINYMLQDYFFPFLCPWKRKKELKYHLFLWNIFIIFSRPGTLFWQTVILTGKKKKDSSIAKWKSVIAMTRYFFNIHWTNKSMLATVLNLNCCLEFSVKLNTVFVWGQKSPASHCYDIFFYSACVCILIKDKGGMWKEIDTERYRWIDRKKKKWWRVGGHKDKMNAEKP